MTIIVGLLFVTLGIWGMLTWFPEMIHFLKGLGPITLLISGILALVVGISSLQSRQKDVPDK